MFTQARGIAASELVETSHLTDAASYPSPRLGDPHDLGCRITERKSVDVNGDASELVNSRQHLAGSKVGVPRRNSPPKHIALIGLPAATGDPPLGVIVLRRVKRLAPHEPGFLFDARRRAEVLACAPVVEKNLINKGQIAMTAESDQHVPVLRASKSLIEPSDAFVAAAPCQHKARRKKDIPVDEDGKARRSLERPPDKAPSIEPEAISAVSGIGTRSDYPAAGVYHLGEPMCSDREWIFDKAPPKPRQRVRQPCVITVHEGDEL